MHEQVKIFESFDPDDISGGYEAWARDHIGLIRDRESHVYLDQNGRRWFVLIVWYLDLQECGNG